MTNRKSHRPTPFRLLICCQNQRPWMTLNGRYAFCSRKDASFGAHQKNWNEDRPTLSSKNVGPMPMTLVSGGIIFVRIFARRFSREGRQTTVGLSTTAIFGVFAGYFFGYFRDEAASYLPRICRT